MITDRCFQDMAVEFCGQNSYGGESGCSVLRFIEIGIGIIRMR